MGEQFSLETIPKSVEGAETLWDIEMETDGRIAVDEGGEATVGTVGPETRAYGQGLGYVLWYCSW